MSLLHRSSSGEQFPARKPSQTPRDPHGPSVEGQAGGRRLSFNPVGEWVPPIAREAPIGAYEVAKGRRIAQVAAAVVYCLFAAGIVFGYAALKPVLIEEGVYRNLCTKDELEKDVRVCYEQELRLNLMFTVAAVVTNVSALPVGALLDRFGPRFTSLLGCFFVGIGCIFMAFAWDMNKAGAEGYIPGYLFLALGGPHVYISAFQLSNTFPRYSGLILALVTGAFDTSSVIFLLYRLLYQATNGSFWPKKFFLAYLVVPILILVTQVTLMPGRSYKTVSELVQNADDSAHDVHSSDDELSDPAEVTRVRKARQERRESVISEVTALLGSNDEQEAETKREKRLKTNSGVWGALHGYTAWQQVRSPWFVLVTLFVMLQMTRINYFIATIRPQYEYMLRSTDRAAAVNGFFDVALPVGGVVAVPFVGLVLDNTSTTFVLSAIVAMATAIGVVGTLPYTAAAYTNVVLFVLYRPFYYTAISDYAAKVFGFDTFGKVYGLIICTSGLFNFVQYALDALTHRRFRNDPLPVNLLLLLVTLAAGLALTVFVGVRSRHILRERLEEEAEGARDVLVPGADSRASEDRHPIDVHAHERLPGPEAGGGSERRGYGAVD